MKKVETKVVPLDSKFDWLHFNAAEINMILGGLRLRKKAILQEKGEAGIESHMIGSQRKIEIIRNIEEKIEDAQVKTHLLV